MADKFIEDNKEVLIQEMATTITNLNSIIAEAVDGPISPDMDGSAMRTYFIAMGVQIGSLTSLFNQYYVMTQGIVNKEKPTGFASLIKGPGKIDE